MPLYIMEVIGGLILLAATVIGSNKFYGRKIKTVRATVVESSSQQSPKAPRKYRIYVVYQYLLHGKHFSNVDNTPPEYDQGQASALLSTSFRIGAEIDALVDSRNPEVSYIFPPSLLGISALYAMSSFLIIQGCYLVLSKAQ